MRVTVVTETYFPQLNGVSRTLGQLVRHLREAGDEVLVVHPDYGVAPEGDHAVLVPAWPVPFYPELRLPRPPFRTVHRRLDRFRPDLIHIATEATLGLSLLGYARRRRIPVVSSFHTNFDQYSGHYRVGWARGVIWRYLRWFHNRTLETYAPSPATIADLTSRGFERLVLWPRGVDSRLFRPDRPGRTRLRAELGFRPDEVVIGYVSRMAVEKNVDYLGAALTMVAAARPEVGFLLVGDGPARSELEARLGPRARFVGYRRGDDLADHYAAADLFGFSSLTETFGNVILEAMASGLPVVALAAGGVGDLVQSEVNGCSLPPDASAQQFADALIALVDDAPRRRVLAAGARAFAVDKSWDAVMEMLRRRYEAIVSAGSPHDLTPSLVS